MGNTKDRGGNVPIVNLSIVMPSYNDGHFLTSAVERYMSQSYVPDELIIVVDGSTDESISILSAMSSAGV